MSISSLVYLGAFLSKHHKDMTCKFALEVQQKRKPKAIMLYANTHLKRRDRDEQQPTFGAFTIFNTKYKDFTKLEEAFDSYKRRAAALYLKNTRELKVNGKQKMEALDKEYKDEFDWYKDVSIVVMDESDKAIFEHLQKFHRWMEYWIANKVIVIMLTATPLRVGTGMEIGVIETVWKIQRLMYNPTDKFEKPNPTGKFVLKPLLHT